MIWRRCYRAKTFEVCGPRIYQSKNKFSPLLTRKGSITWQMMLKLKLEIPGETELCQLSGNKDWQGPILGNAHWPSAQAVYGLTGCNKVVIYLRMPEGCCIRLLSYPVWTTVPLYGTTVVPCWETMWKEYKSTPWESPMESLQELAVSHCWGH